METQGRVRDGMMVEGSLWKHPSEGRAELVTRGERSVQAGGRV